MWEIEATDQFLGWFEGLSDEAQEALDEQIEPLALRVLFMFDPRRQVVLLVGGDKSGAWSEWYELAVPEADDLYDMYLAELKEEGLL